jgi:16S rRNA (guanine527-N7)-methyltransferase
MPVPNADTPEHLTDEQMTALVAVLERSRSLGFLGEGPIEDHVVHAMGFMAVADHTPGRFLDLGSGGGVPGLVLAMAWPTTIVTLLDSQQKRCVILEEAVGQLGIGDRVSVARGRAEDFGRDPQFRGAFDLVVSRSFGPPAVVAECAAPFLSVGGLLAVSEPPDAVDRWPREPLAELGLEPEPQKRRDDAPRIQALRQVSLVPDRYPRRVGIPAKRPLF